MTRKRAYANIITKVMMFILIAAMICSFMSYEAAAEGLSHETVDNKNMSNWVSNSEKLKVNANKYQTDSFSVGNTTVKSSFSDDVRTFEAQGKWKYNFAIKKAEAGTDYPRLEHKDANGNVMTLWFKDTGDIMGEKTAVKMEIVKVHFGKRETDSNGYSNSDTYSVFAHLTDTHMVLGGNIADADEYDGHIFGGRMLVTYEMTVYSMATGKIINYPFGLVVKDIDQYNPAAKTGEEIWLRTEDFTSYRTWKKYSLGDPDYEDGWAKFRIKSAGDALNTDDPESYNEAGFFAISNINKNTIRVKHQVGGDMGTSIFPYKLYDSGQFKIKKTSLIEPSKLTGAYTPAGMTFGLYRGDRQVGADIRINASGESSVIEVPAGTYVIKEKSANGWYVNAPQFQGNANKSWQTITVRKNDTTANGQHTYVVKDPPVLKSFTMTKEIKCKYNVKPSDLSKIKFTLTSKTVNGRKFTVHVGKIRNAMSGAETAASSSNQFGFADLPIDTYTLQEDARSLDDAQAGFAGTYDKSSAELTCNVTVTAGGVTVKNGNTILSSYVNTWVPETHIRLRVVKKVEDGAENQTLSGFGFTLYKDSGLTQPVGRAVAESDSTYLFSEITDFGTYYLKEDDKAGYEKVSPDPMMVEITEDTVGPSVDTDTGVVYLDRQVTYTNRRLYPTIKVNKKEILSDGRSGNNVNNIMFQLYDSSGTKIAQKRSVRDSDDPDSGVVTFSNADLRSGSKLVPGTYTIKEADIDSKYISSWPLSDGIPSKTIEIPEGYTDVFVADTCENKDTTVTFAVKVNKGASEPVNKDNSRYSLKNITYSVYATYAEGELSDKIGTIRLKEDSEDRMKASGKFAWDSSDNTLTKTVYVQEDPVPSGCGFRRDEKVYEVSAQAGKTVAVNNGEELKDEPEKGSISFDKVIRCNNPDYEGEAPDPSLLTFRMKNNETGEEYTANPKQDETDPWKSRVTFSELPLGTYLLTEEGLENYDMFTMQNTVGSRVITINEGDNSESVKSWNNNAGIIIPEDSYTLTINKTSEIQTGSPIYDMSGIQYEVYSDEGCSDETHLGTITLLGNSSAASGSLVIKMKNGPDILPVWIQERALAEDALYYTNTEVLRADLKAGELVTIGEAEGAVNTPKMANLEFVKEIYSDAEGVTLPEPDQLEFRLINQDNQALEAFTATVGDDDTVRFTNIPVGHYTLIEHGCEKYAGNDRTLTDMTGPLELDIHVGDNGIGTEGNKWRNKLTVIPQPRMFKLSITKGSGKNWDFGDGSYSLNGISYGIYTDGSCSAESRVKDEEGRNADIVLTGGARTASGERLFILYDAPEVMTFFVKENEPPEDSGYKKDAKVYSVEAHSITNADDPATPVKNGLSDLKDEPETGTLEFTKVIECDDPEEEIPAPDKLTFTLVKQGTENSEEFTYTAHPDKDTGLVSFSDEMPLGKYTLTESGADLYKTGSGYMLDVTGAVTVTIKAGSDNRINRDNKYYNLWVPEEPAGGIDIYKQTPDSRAEDKSVFCISIRNIETGKDIVTKQYLDTDGKYISRGLPAGHYLIHEHIDDNERLTELQKKIYRQPDDQIAEIKESDVRHHSIYVDNLPEKTDITVYKRSSDGNVADISFVMKGTAFDGRTVEYPTAVTEERMINGVKTGVAVFEDVVAGEYVIEETGFSETGYVSDHILVGHDLPAQEVVISPDDMSIDPIEFVNIPASFEIRKKEILEDGETQGDDPVFAAEYTLYKYDGTPASEEDISEAPSVSLRTDEDGYASTDRLSAGTYWLYETEIPAGYVYENLLPDDYPIASLRGTESSIGRFVKTFTISASHPNESITDPADRNKREAGKFWFKKMDEDGQPVEGAGFTLWKNDPSSLYGRINNEVVRNLHGEAMRAVTDRYGSILADPDGDGVYETPFYDIEWGTYWLEETMVPSGYQKAEIKEITLNSLVGTSRDLGVISDVKEPGKAELTKYKKGDHSVTLSGAVFDLYTADDKLVAGNLTTDQNGKILCEGLKWGAYYFKETKAPEGYTIDPSPIRFSINRQTQSTIVLPDYSTSIMPLPVTAENEKAPAEILITVRVDKDSVWEAHGDPSFFAVLEDSNGKIRKQAVTFDKKYVEEFSDSTGYASKTVTFSAETDEDYTAYTTPADRYILDRSYRTNQSGQPEGPVTEFLHAERIEGTDRVRINIASSSDLQKTGKTTFVYTKHDWSDYGDETVLTNAVKKSKSFVALNASWKGDSSKVDADLLYDPASQLSVHAVFDDGTAKELKTSEYSVADQRGDPVQEDANGDRRWPGAAGSYVYTVSARIDGVMRTDSFAITVIPKTQVKVYFHTGGAPAHLPVAHEHETIGGETVETITMFKNQRLGQAIAIQSFNDESEWSRTAWPGNELTMWSKTDGFGEEMSGSDEITEDTHYYAVWNAAAFKLIYNQNLDDSSVKISGMPPRTVTEQGRTVSVSSKTPGADKGYDFKGWSADANAEEADAAYAPEQMISSEMTLSRTALTLYAVWEKHSAVVKYDPNEAEGSKVKEPAAGYSEELPAEQIPPQLTIRYGEDRLAAAAPEKTGFAFTGWNTEYDGTGREYQPDTRILEEGEDPERDEIILYAQWKQLHLGDNGSNAQGDSGNLQWEDIRVIGDSGIAKTFFAEDFISVKRDLSDGIINDTNLAKYTREMKVNDKTVHAMIAGFDHDKTSDGGTAAISFITYEAAAEGVMELGNKPVSGWKNSSARTRTLNTLKGQLETDLSNRLEAVVKDSVNAGDALPSETTDLLFLPSVEELTGQYKYVTIP